jgi:hypothetical protein
MVTGLAASGCARLSDVFAASRVNTEYVFPPVTGLNGPSVRSRCLIACRKGRGEPVPCRQECFMIGRILAILAFFIAASAGAQATTQTVVLTLSHESGYPSGFCRLDVSASLNGGEARLFCGRGADGAREGRTRMRRITADESEELRQLVQGLSMKDRVTRSDIPND